MLYKIGNLEKRKMIPEEAVLQPPQGSGLYPRRGARRWPPQSATSCASAGSERDVLSLRLH
ncbi:hypothetical protein J22TS1_19120 [Siminovitchia terrae]|nr:hypothetical protein J22TS1_19120 [Siminovitchia terrae]